MHSCFEALVFLAIGAFVWWVQWKKEQSREEQARQRDRGPSQRELQERGRRVAGALNGRFHPWGERGVHVVLFKAGQRDAQLTWGRSATTVQVDLRGISPGMLLIHPNSGPAGGAGMIGRDLLVGDTRFDNAYMVKARPEELVERLFTVERRPVLISIMLRLRRFTRATFDLSAQSLAIRVGRSVDDTGDLLEICRAAEAFAELLVEVSAGGTGIEWGETTTSAEGECQVCGTGLAGKIVRCAACKTPHHRDCWTYIGECSTYACRETRFV